MKITYWYAKCIGDSDVYSVREKTKKEAMKRLEEWDYNDKNAWKGQYNPPIKVTIEYDSGFDLLKMCSEEDHHFWEARASIKAGF